jgi:hypothetical protein
MELKAGARLASTVCQAEVVVVRPPVGDVDLRCGGHPMAPPGTSKAVDGPIVQGLDAGTLLGKRYVHDGTGLELLCTKGGPGSLSVDGTILPVKDAKPLPSSD